MPARQPDAGRRGELRRSHRIAAELAVAGLTGVRNVRDEIEIAYDANPADVASLVQGALDRYALIPDDSDVGVYTTSNTVTSGCAPPATR